jgi:hypothetical protein
LACHLCALLATGALAWSARNTPWLLPAMLLHGIILVFLFAPLHASIHNADLRITPYRASNARNPGRSGAAMRHSQRDSSREAVRPLVDIVWNGRLEP